MGESESKHDKVLSRVHLWVAVLGGIVTLLIGLYNFKNIFFPVKADEKPVLTVSSPASNSGPLSSGPFASMDRNGDGKVRENEWRGSHEDFERLDLDGSGSLNSRDFAGTSFQDMDTNGDGSITRMEWRKIRHAFDVLDADSDGKITPAELSVRDQAASG